MTRNFYTLIITVLSAFTVNAQQDTIQANVPIGVEKSIFNVQTGILGVWANHEARLGRNFALRTELGMDTSIFIDIYTGIFTGVFTEPNIIVQIRPVINLEPRWYYNLEKRSLKGSNSAKNAGNFLSVAFNYMPDWFYITNNDHYRINNQLSIIPRWSIRRNIGKSNFNYEAGAGIEHQLEFIRRQGYSTTLHDTYIDLHVRIGYTFK